MLDYLALAREAAVETYGTSAVGDFSHSSQEAQDGVLTYFFASKLKGYPDWHISVTLFIDGWSATVSEVNLLPGEMSLVAPKWVPWSERLADYKALQAALEAEAAAAAAASEDEEDEDLDDAEAVSEESAEGQLLEDAATEPEETKEPLAVSEVPEGVDAEDDSDTAGGKSKGFFKWKTLRGSKKRK